MLMLTPLAARRLSSSTKASDPTSVVCGMPPPSHWRHGNFHHPQRLPILHQWSVGCPRRTIGGTATFIIHKGFRSYISGLWGAPAEPLAARQLSSSTKASDPTSVVCGILRRATSAKASDPTSVVCGIRRRAISAVRDHSVLAATFDQPTLWSKESGLDCM